LAVAVAVAVVAVVVVVLVLVDRPAADLRAVGVRVVLRAAVRLR
jgi:hypothetical protein